MRVAFGGIFHETNTFATQTTTAKQFESHILVESHQIVNFFKGTSGSNGGVIDQAEKLNIDLVPTFYAETTPSGMVDHETFERYKRKLLDLIPIDIDGVILILHGSMVTNKDQDPEGTLIREVKEKVGENTPVVCTLDLHANVSSEMNEFSDCMVGFDTYPHIDYYPRAVEATNIIYNTIQGKLKPTSYLLKPNFMPVVQRMYTEHSPMKDLFELVWEIESYPKVISVSVTGGFPYADVEWAGFGILVTTDNEPKLAKQYASKLNKLLEELRDEFTFNTTAPEEGVLQAKKIKEYPIVLVDSSDNIGGGSSGDGTVLLFLLNKHNLRNSLVFIKDEEAVHKAINTGIDNMFIFEVGGKTDDKHGKPVFVQGKVKKIINGKYRSERTKEYKNMGSTALIDFNGINLIITTERVPGFDLQAPRELGVEPEQLDYIVVKGAVQWRSSYGKIAKHEIEVDCPGVTSANLNRFQYVNLRENLYPHIERRK